MLSLFRLIILFTLSTTLHAGSIYQCVDDKGSKSFQGKSCPKDTQRISLTATNTTQDKLKVDNHFSQMDPSKSYKEKMHRIGLVSEIYAVSEVYSVVQRNCPSGEFPRIFTQFKTKYNSEIELGKSYYFQGPPELKLSPTQLKEAREHLDYQINSVVNNFKFTRNIDELCAKELRSFEYILKRNNLD